MVTPLKNVDYDSALPEIVYIRFEKTYSLASGKNLGITREELGWFVPTGYAPLGIVSIEAVSGTVVRGINPFDDPNANATMVWLRNAASSDISSKTFSVTFSYIRNDMVIHARPFDKVYFNERYNPSDPACDTVWADWMHDLPDDSTTVVDIIDWKTYLSSVQ